ncbi:ABC transporter permease [Egicoccus halophilus]|uniref:Transport permease protein n=1 Tax=Egicoccus halophilus TaxID=1670830 RepID=A0A8J3ACW2_9ACTN|nr:ABC transporter permease [Egicoccus halophilus]GGI08991.1 transport permease protein [Egicoccus halophilus]
MTAVPADVRLPGGGADDGRIGLRRTLTDTLVLTRRNLLRNVRLPQLLLFSTIQPVMFLLLFNYVFGGAIGGSLPEGYAYIQWLMPGLLIQIATFGAGQTAMGLTEDLDKGVIDRFRSLPMSRSAVLAGRTLADLLRNAAVLGLMLVVGFAIGFRWETSVFGFLGGFAVALLFGYALSWVMATIGLAVRNPEAAQSAVMLPVFPLVFASSVFLPTQTMPDWLRVFADHQPITVIANALRALMLGPAALLPGQTVGGQVVAALAWIVGITAVFAVLAVRLYRKVERA